jgi:hypothetical protein
MIDPEPVKEANLAVIRMITGLIDDFDNPEGRRSLHRFVSERCPSDREGGP